MTLRTRATALATSVLLLVSALSLLVLRPTAAGAQDLEAVPAEFVITPGGALSKEYAEPKIGSAEARPDPDGCRNNPAIALTCGAHRIKLVGRKAGYFLRITTAWTSRDASGNSVPDVDTYLFAEPTAYIPYEQIGGVSGANPETIKLVNPTQDEYDVVIGAYAGAITSYTVSVEYTNAASAPTPGILPDFVLSPDAAPVSKSYTSALAVPTIAGQPPDSCRNDPSQDVVCDVYRLKLNRSLAPDAVNFVVITLAWNPRVTPDIKHPAGGVGGEQVPNLDMYVFDAPAHELEGVDANLFANPERAAFVASQDEYDIVIQSKRGVSAGYTLSGYLSDELFDKPFELLDPITGQPITAPVADGQGGYFNPVDGSVVVPPLALAPIDVDNQIAGIGLGTTEQFENLLALGRSNVRNTTAAAKPPSALILWLVLIVAPAGLCAVGIAVMRRRHHEAF